MTASPLPDGTLAGYRLVRKIGFGTRSDVYLGVGVTGTVALKVFRGEASIESIASELDALGRVESPHLVRLLDVSNGPEGPPVLILERASRGSVAVHLAERETIECGEVVTLLAPIAALVAELHDAGVAHTRIGAAAVHLGAEGQPVLLGLGHCELFAAAGTMAAIDTEPAAAVDRDALARFALALLERVRTTAGDNRTRDLESWIESAPRAYEFPGELAERLFSCAEAMPVAIAASGERGTGRALPARIVAVESPAPVSSASEPVGADHPPGWMPAWVANLLVEYPAEMFKKRFASAAKGVRPRFWIAATAVALALVVAIALIPSGGVPAERSSRRAPVVTRSSPIPSPAPMPDDPLLAAKALLALRQTCFRDRSILCLDGVDEASSGAFSIDAALIQQIQTGGEIPASTRTVAATLRLRLTERLGDTALIDLGGQSEPASILVIKTKAGWRIRDILSGAQASPTPASG
jgi:hypothetical protein